MFLVFISFCSRTLNHFVIISNTCFCLSSSSLSIYLSICLSLSIYIFIRESRTGGFFNLTKAANLGFGKC